MAHADPALRSRPGSTSSCLGEEVRVELSRVGWAQQQQLLLTLMLLMLKHLLLLLLLLQMHLLLLLLTQLLGTPRHVPLTSPFDRLTRNHVVT